MKNKPGIYKAKFFKAVKQPAKEFDFNNPLPREPFVTRAEVEGMIAKEMLRHLECDLKSEQNSVVLWGFVLLIVVVFWGLNLFLR